MNSSSNVWDVDSPKIMLVEDDQIIGESLSQALRGQGYEVAWMQTGQSAMQNANDAELVILDLSLPDLDGLLVCRHIRKANPAAQILMLTARREEVDIVLGLDAGADDYLTKPFRLAELLARVRARLRKGEDISLPLIVGDLTIDRDARRVHLAGEELELRAKEFDLLTLLAANAGRAITREKAIHDVWDENWYGSTKTLDIHIRAIRVKLGEAEGPSRITTLRGVGYRYENPPATESSITH